MLISRTERLFFLAREGGYAAHERDENLTYPRKALVDTTLRMTHRCHGILHCSRFSASADRTGLYASGSGIAQVSRGSRFEQATPVRFRYHWSNSQPGKPLIIRSGKASAQDG